MDKRKILASLLAAILVLAMLVGLVAGFLPTRTSAASSSELKAQINVLKQQKDSLDSQIKGLKKKISANASEIEKMVEEKSQIDQEIFLMYEQISNINDQISIYTLLIADKQEELVAAEAVFQQLTEENRSRIQAMEEEGSLSYWSVLFQANDFSDFLDRINMIQEIAASDRRRMDEMNAAAKTVAEAKEVLQEEKNSLEQTRQTLDATQQELEIKREKANQLLADLVDKGMEYESMVEESEDAQAQVMLDIANKQEEYEDARYKEWLATSVPPTTKPKPPSKTEPTETKKPTTKPTEATTKPSETTKPTEETKKPTEETKKPTEETKKPTEETTKPTEESTKPTEPEKITWKVPIKYKKFTSPYGWRTDPVYGGKRFHYGVDLAADEGTKIVASRGGTVTTATYDKDCGYYVQINHGDGYKSIYMHMTRYTVKKGDKVSQGQTIGYCGSTGKSTGPHLHFGISYNGSYVNPAKYIPI